MCEGAIPGRCDSDDLDDMGPYDFLQPIWGGGYIRWGLYTMGAIHEGLQYCNASRITSRIKSPKSAANANSNINPRVL